MEIKAPVEIPSHPPSNFNEWSQLLPKARFWVPSNLVQRWRTSHCGQAVRAWRLPPPPRHGKYRRGREGRDVLGVLGFNRVLGLILSEFTPHSCLCAPNLGGEPVHCYQHLSGYF